MKRLTMRLTTSDLQNLKELSLEEHENFFKRNPHLKDAYHNSLAGICLCQGAASHYLNPNIGIKDFDIWHFYVANEKINFPYRAHKVIKSGYRGLSIDYLKRAIPRHLARSCRRNPKGAIMAYLTQKNTKTKRLLLKKAIVGLFPNSIFSSILWKGNYPKV